MIRKILFVTLICASLLFVVFHQTVFSIASGWIIKFYTSRHFGESLHYDQVIFNGNTLLISRPSLKKNDFSAQNLAFKFGIDWQTRQINLNIQLDQPVWHIEDIEKTEKAWKSLIKHKKHSWFKVNSILKVREGALKWLVDQNEMRSLGFDLEFDNLLGGNLKAYFDKNQSDDNQFSINLTSSPEAMLLKWDCSHLSCESWLRLLSLVYPKLDHWKINSGLVEGQLTAVFPSDHRPYLEGKLVVENFSFTQPQAQLQGEIKKAKIQLDKNSQEDEGIGWKLTTIGKLEILDQAKLTSYSDDGYWSLEHVLGNIVLDGSKRALIALEADCNHQNCYSHFKLKGQANLNCRRSFNVTLNLECMSDGHPDGFVDFLIYQPKGSLKIAEIHCKQLCYPELSFLQTLLAPYWPSLKQIEFEDGKLNALAYAEFTKRGFENIQCEHFEVENLKFKALPLKIGFQFPFWRGHGSFNLNQEDVWSSLNAEVYIENGQIDWKKMKSHSLKQIETKLLVKKGEIHPSAVKMKLADLKGIMDITWGEEKKIVTLNLEGKSQELAELFPPLLQQAIQKRFKDQDVGIMATIKGKEEQLQVDGIVHIQRDVKSAQKDLIHFGYELKKDLHQSEASFMPVGWFHAKDLPLEKFVSPFIFRKDNAQLSGVGEFLGYFDHQKIKMKYGTRDLKIENEDLRIDIKELHSADLEELPGTHTFDLMNNTHEGILPVLNSSYLEKNSGLCFLDIATQAHFKGETISLRDLEGTCNDIHLSGQIDLDYTDPAPGVFSMDIDFSSFNGKVSQVKLLLDHVKQAQMISKIPLEGDIESRGEGLKLRFDFIPKDYTVKSAFQATITNGSMDISKANMNVRDLNMDVEYQAGQLVFNEIQGSLLLGKPQQSEEYFITGNHIRFKDFEKQNIEMDLEVKGKGRPFFKLVGTTSLTPESTIDIQIDKTRTHICCIYPHDFHLHLADWSNVKLLHIEAPFQIDSIWPDIRLFLVKTGLFLPNHLLEKVKTINQAKGIFNLALHYEDKNDVLDYQMDGHQIGFNTSKYENFYLKGKKHQNRWNIEQLTLDNLSLSADLHSQNDELGIDFLSISYGPSFVLGLEGVFLEKQSRLNATIHLLETNLADLNQYPALKDFTTQWPLKGLLKGKGKLSITFIDKAPWYIVDTDMQAHIERFEINQLPLSLDKTIGIGLKSSRHFEIKDMSSSLKAGETTQAAFNIDCLDYDLLQNQMTCSKLAFNIPSHHLEDVGTKLHRNFPDLIDPRLKELLQTIKSDGNLKGSLMIHKSPNTSSLEMRLDEGLYNFRKKQYHLTDFKLNMNPQELIFSGLSFHERCFFMLEGQASLPDLDHGILVLTNFGKTNSDSSPLFIHWKNYGEKGLVIQSMQGSFCGLNIDLNTSSLEENPPWTMLQGSIGINFNDLCPLLAEETAETVHALETGSSYVFTGNYWMNPDLGEDLLETLYFQGDVYAKDAILKSYLFDEMQAHVKYSPGVLEVTGATISDSSGTMDCPEINVTQKQNTKDWFFSIPYLLIKNLHPSTLRDLKEEGSPKFKNLLIKRAELQSLQGQLDRIDSWQAMGSLHFQNPSRKNLHHPLLTIPAEIILRLGLDPNVLNPVTGTIYFTMQGDRLYLNKFKDVYSEGRGSKFYLASRTFPSWVDMKGNLFVQIRMKQYNLIFKLAELFTVSVQGNLKKPKYSLQRHEKSSSHKDKSFYLLDQYQTLEGY